MPETLPFRTTDTAALLAALAAQLAHLEDMIKKQEDMHQLRTLGLGRRISDLEALLLTLRDRRVLRGHVAVPLLGPCPIVLTDADPT
jgi:hypothetical protein